MLFLVGILLLDRWRLGRRRAAAIVAVEWLQYLAGGRLLVRGAPESRLTDLHFVELVV